MLFPNEQEGEPICDWRVHYYAAQRGFFLLLSSTFVIDLLDTLLKGLPYFLGLGPLYWGTFAMQIVLLVIAAFTRSTRFHAAFAIYFLAFTAVMLGSNLLRLT